MYRSCLKILFQNVYTPLIFNKLQHKMNEIFLGHILLIIKTILELRFLFFLIRQKEAIPTGRDMRSRHLSSGKLANLLSIIKQQVIPFSSRKLLGTEILSTRLQ